MSNEALHGKAVISYPFGPQATAAGHVELSTEGIERFDGVVPLYKALRAALGDQLGKPIMEGATLLFPIETGQRDGNSYELESFMDDMVSTFHELRRNANVSRPLPISAAVKKPAHVAVARVIARLRRDLGFGPVAVLEDKVQGFPEFVATDFIEPESHRELRRSGTFLIKGLVRDDKLGHQLLVGENKLAVHLPLDNPRWAWSVICRVLDEETKLYGTLLRTSKSHPWTVDDATILVGQRALPGT